MIGLNPRAARVRSQGQGGEHGFLLHKEMNMILKGLCLAAIPRRGDSGCDIIEIRACYKVPRRPAEDDEVVIRSQHFLPPQILNNDERFSYTELVLKRLVHHFVEELQSK
jgi:hypothetical protein